MLEMSIDDHIVMQQHEFAELVMDDWGWKRQFLTSTAMYSEKAARLSR